ncbi:putative reverse transcriptase domain-containing protein [Tanacetum coccineum]
MMCTKMVPEEEDRIEKFIGGLPNNIQGNVIAAEPIKIQDVVHIANNLMDQKLKGHNVGGQNVARAYTAGNNEKRRYAGPLPYCNKCKLHHEGPCTVKCGKCNKVGHMARDCKNAVAIPATLRYPINRGNKAGKKTEEAKGKAYVLGGGEANPDSNLARSVETKLGKRPRKLEDMAYVLGGGEANPDSNIVTADGRISKTNTVLRGCTLGLLGHPFNIDLMPVELGSFDVIIGMDWLANHHAVILCDEKIVRIPYGDEVLIVQGDSSDKGKKSKLSIISCAKTQKYIKRGYPIFLAQVTKKETEDKSEEKRLEDVPIIRDFRRSFQRTCLDFRQCDKSNSKLTWS